MGDTKTVYIKDEESSENVSGKCRGCLMEDRKMNDLFDKHGQRDKKGFCSLGDVLLETTGIEIKYEVGFPILLCELCTNAVMNFYNFKEILLETEEYFNKIRQERTTLKYKSEVFDIQVPPDIVSESDRIANMKNKKCNLKFQVDKSKSTTVIRKRRKKRSGTHQEDSDKKSYVCEICGLSCKKKEYLARHQETHSDERKYVCKHCNKAVKLKSSFIKHLKLHTNPRQIVCDVCGQRFNLRAHLDIHYKAKHLRIRDFQCTLCDKAFSMKATLEQHIERHNPNRERKFGCNYCSMTYMEKRHLVRHHREKHDKVKFDCHFCERSYIQANDLNKHLKKCHRPENADCDRTVREDIGSPDILQRHRVS